MKNIDRIFTPYYKIQLNQRFNRDRHLKVKFLSTLLTETDTPVRYYYFNVKDMVREKTPLEQSYKHSLKITDSSCKNIRARLNN